MLGEGKTSLCLAGHPIRSDPIRGFEFRSSERRCELWLQDIAAHVHDFYHRTVPGGFGLAWDWGWKGGLEGGGGLGGDGRGFGVEGGVVEDLLGLKIFG